MNCPSCGGEFSPSDKFCRVCGAQLSTPSQMPTAAGTIAEAPKPAEAPHVARLISSDSIPAGGFTPGTILADRYRIIGLLGRGGMGEVYRADDLKLGQPVALKFLPPKLAEDPVRRERFFAEVRITRQLSHPNICRVYDIAEIDGRHFLSMEFIDGEDLASLLKRIGHLTNEKALDIARQLAAGLAAAHERGVLHRDLKPANIMLDGHGRVRITDFGLAIAAEDESQATEIAGTPAYMAPEQLAGKRATVRSDIYSLGLILYEVYTGKKAFTAKNLVELREQKETQVPRAPSEIRQGIDPVVERVIQRCMEKDPSSRPASVAQLAQALPGGDPLAAAIAAGETPSPEMVAASGSKEGLRPAIAWGLLVFIVLGTLALMAMKDRASLHCRIPFEKRPEILVERSREILKKVGYTEDFADSAYGFVQNTDLLQYIEKSDKTTELWKTFDSEAILFWYRQSPRLLNAITSITNQNPPLQYSGEMVIVLDTKECLVSLHVVPPQFQSIPDNIKPPDWKILFDEAGFDIDQWTEARTKRNPLFYADTEAMWEGSFPKYPGHPVQIRAAAFQGKPVSFEITGPWNQESQTTSSQSPIWQIILNIVGVLLTVIAIGGGIFFARRNLRLGRGDRRNAKRLALIILGTSVFALVLQLPHNSPYVAFLVMPYVAGLVWLFYIAFEPYMRRRWPQFFVSWTKVLSGNWKDPLVGRDALIGAAMYVLTECIFWFTHYILPPLLGYKELAAPFLIDLQQIMGTRFFISGFFWAVVSPIVESLLFICLLFILMVLLRNQTIAIAVCCLLLVLLSPLDSSSIWSLITKLALSPLWFIVLKRFGLFAPTVTFMTAILVRYSPIGFHVSAWYSGYGYAALAIFAAIVLYAFYTSLGGRPLLAPSRLDE